MNRRTTYARARDYDYDPGLEEFLTSEIVLAIADACRCSGTDGAALPSQEMMSALLNVLAMTMTLLPCAQSPEDLRNEIAKLAVRLLQLTREQLGSGDFETLFKTLLHGGDVGGMHNDHAP